MSFGYQTLGFGAGTPASGPLVSDTFTDSNGTALTAHTPDVDSVGGGYGNAVGNLEIESNRLVGATTATEHHANMETNVSDIDASIVGNLSAIAGNNGVFIQLRYTDADNFWLGGFWGNTIGDVREGQIWERNAGSYTKRGSASGISYTRGTDIDIRVVASGATIQVYLAGNLEVTYASATLNQTETIHGVRLDYDIQTADNFTVTAL